MLNNSTKVARLIVEQLLTAGVQHAVLAPGSRSAPLAIALLQAQEAGLVSVHVRIDERDAGYLALGLAKATGSIVPVVVTSGTAVANLMPAVVEGFQSGLPLVLLTADRPEVARGNSTPQTINQENIFGNFVKGSIDTSINDFVVSDLRELLNLAQSIHCGPVHLNIQFELPLVPAEDELHWQPKLDLADVSANRFSVNPLKSAQSFAFSDNGLILAGDIRDQAEAQAVGELATLLNWPIVCEPTSNLHSHSHALAHGILLITSQQLPAPAAIITAGTVGLSRPILKLLKETGDYTALHLSGNGPELPDPVQNASRILDFVPTTPAHADSAWLDLWQTADQKVGNIINDYLQSESLSGPSAAVTVWSHAAEPDHLMVAASWSVRHLESFAPKRAGLTVVGNRGANGIDGLISTAWGAALASAGRTYLLMGDVAFLHDIGALAIPEGEDHPDLTIVVLDNDGGGIFNQLEQGEPQYANYFEKAFGTPHGKDLWQISESFGFASTRVTTRTELSEALNRSGKIPGVHIVICLTGSRANENQLLNQIRTKVTAELSTPANSN
ncbi:MAG: 2-succinyl-5-enolpyruvyl-6-hydroxy-3-cyclohexene-1-carboxylic-acid synthase [Actinomycetales bacterium]|nr:2-succinyl-5-enolpyruvyl-6-hydroxy-3-cyclohexene-1-carboxylic-acid synthase [Actinomycetales bacterium]